MSWNDIIYGLGDLATESFKLLPALGNNMNYVIMVIGSAMGLWWIMQLVKYHGATKDNPSAE